MTNSSPTQRHPFIYFTSTSQKYIVTQFLLGHCIHNLSPEDRIKKNEDFANCPIRFLDEPCLSNLDYEDSNFRENRFKYRNKSTMMKKLRDAASSKTKKTVIVLLKERKKGCCENTLITKSMIFVYLLD